MKKKPKNILEAMQQTENKKQKEKGKAAPDRVRDGRGRALTPLIPEVLKM